MEEKDETRRGLIHFANGDEEFFVCPWPDCGKHRARPATFEGGEIVLCHGCQRRSQISDVRMTYVAQTVPE